jgi:DNA-binding Xre family transcriptional regulator
MVYDTISAARSQIHPAGKENMMPDRQSREEAKERLPGKIYSRFGILLAEKKMDWIHADNRGRISYEDIKDDIKMRTGVNIASSTLSAWANNEVERFDSVTLVVLCDYFGCKVGDLLEYRPFSPSQD